MKHHPIKLVGRVGLVGLRKYEKRTPEEKARIAALYASGLQQKQLMMRFPGLSADTLRDILVEHKVPRRPRTQLRTYMEEPFP